MKTSVTRVVSFPEKYLLCRQLSGQFQTKYEPLMWFLRSCFAPPLSLFEIFPQNSFISNMKAYRCAALAGTSEMLSTDLEHNRIATQHWIPQKRINSIGKGKFCRSTFGNSMPIRRNCGSLLCGCAVVRNWTKFVEPTQRFFMLLFSVIQLALRSNGWIFHTALLDKLSVAWIFPIFLIPFDLALSITLINMALLFWAGKSCFWLTSTATSGHRSFGRTKGNIVP